MLVLLVEYLSAGYGLRFSTGANGITGFPRIYRNLVLFLQESPEISGNLWEFTGECNLGILYSSSLLRMTRAPASEERRQGRKWAAERHWSSRG